MGQNYVTYGRRHFVGVASVPQGAYNEVNERAGASI